MIEPRTTGSPRLSTAAAAATGVLLTASVLLTVTDWSTALPHVEGYVACDWSHAGSVVWPAAAGVGATFAALVWWTMGPTRRHRTAAVAGLAASVAWLVGSAAFMVAGVFGCGP